jgi:hypothetical protein
LLIVHGRHPDFQMLDGQVSGIAGRVRPFFLF